jgi:hypothetical protein
LNVSFDGGLRMRSLIVMHWRVRTAQKTKIENVLVVSEMAQQFQFAQDPFAILYVLDGVLDLLDGDLLCSYLVLG